MAVTLATLRNDTLLLLNEASNSVVGDLANGTGGTTTNTSDVIDAFINEAAGEMARSCVFIPSSGTVSIALSPPSGDLDISSTNIWFPMSVGLTNLLGGTTNVLTHTSELRIRAWFRDYETVSSPVKLPNGSTTSTATYWWHRGPFKIYIFPKVSSITANIYGASIPATITGAVSASFAPDDILRNTLPVYAAMKIAMKNLDDPSLAARIQLWQTWWLDGCNQLWNRLDSSLKIEGSPFAVPPIAPPTAK